MWGHIATEAVTIQNFNFGFSTYKSDVLVHLSQWQYWWWFWFSLVWTVYLFFIIRTIQKRTFQFNPIINTSIRGHGKWGDFLVALIPLSWCGNILVNSNFILRMIEWQNESSLFTIRIQGKQWYWVYKYDASAANSIWAAPKNQGRNMWKIDLPQESYCTDTYYQALQLGAQIEFSQLYAKLLGDNQLSKITVEQSSLNGRKVELSDVDCRELGNLTSVDLYFTDNNTSNKHDLSQELNTFNNQLFKYFNSIREKKNYMNTDKLLDRLFDIFSERSDDLSEEAQLSRGPTTILALRHYLSIAHFFQELKIKIEDGTYDHPRFTAGCSDEFAVRDGVYLRDYSSLDSTENYAANLLKKVTKKPARIVRGKHWNYLADVVDSMFDNLYQEERRAWDEPEILDLKLESNSESVEEKVNLTELLWGFRQKKYKRIQKLSFKPMQTYDPETFQGTGMANSKKAVSLKSDVLKTIDSKKNSKGEPFDYQRAIKYNRHRSELVPVTVARRLLRVKRTLVLPAHTNITAITNSYDVVHSWFIPGLGLKFDCVPGRSTHHTFYIDNVGFYYGQCAEICGRYHHHMPIRLCALPFEQFLLWWQRKGYRRMHRVSLMRGNEAVDGKLLKFRYNW